MTFKYEIGDEFKGPYRSWMKVVARNRTGNGIIQYWTIDEYGEACTLSEYRLDTWTKIEPFFEVGDTFKSPFNSSVTMTVTHLDEELEEAWVTRAYDNGKPRHKESVTRATWRQVKEEVLRNRKD